MALARKRRRGGHVAGSAARVPSGEKLMSYSAMPGSPSFQRARGLCFGLFAFSTVKLAPAASVLGGSTSSFFTSRLTSYIITTPEENAAAQRNGMCGTQRTEHTLPRALVESLFSIARTLPRTGSYTSTSPELMPTTPCRAAPVGINGNTRRRMHKARARATAAAKRQTRSRGRTKNSEEGLSFACPARRSWHVGVPSTLSKRWRHTRGTVCAIG